MNFSDRTLVRLADPATRAAVFDRDALETVVAAAYDADALATQGPYQAMFDELRLGVAQPLVTTADGTWNAVGSIERGEASFAIAGLGPPAPRIDALWRGAVVARVVRPAATIDGVVTNWPVLGTIDADIENDLGALPAAANALENERRARLIERLRTRLDQPDRLDDARLDSLLADAGAASVSQLLDDRAMVGAATLTFSDAPPANPRPLALPVTAAVLIREAGVSLAELMAETRAVLERLAPMALQRPVDPALHPRNSLIAIWVVPREVFDDVDWPGAAAGMSAAQRRTARRRAAAAWLGAAGIALAVPP